MNAPGQPTATVHRQGPWADNYGRPRRKFSHHAVADQPLIISGPPPSGADLRDAGDALCGKPGPWEEPPEGLFAAPLGCERCAAIAAHEGITITGLPETGHDPEVTQCAT